MSFLFALISSVGDILQITQGVPYAVVNILMAVILFIVLGRQPARERRAMNSALIVGVIASSIMSGTSLLLCHARRDRRRACRHRQSGPRRHHADRRGERLCRDRADRLALSRHRGGRVRRRRGQPRSSPIWSSPVTPISSRPGLSLMFFGIGVSALIGRPFVGALITGLPRLSVPGLDPDGIGARLAELRRSGLSRAADGAA